MEPNKAIERARALFLDDANTFGCAETTFIVLKEAFGLADAGDSAAAMALNGGVASSGGICGAITGGALAVGMLAGERFEEGPAGHARAKRAARRAVARVMDDFRERFGAVDCVTLLGGPIRTLEQHRAFIDSGIWRDRCMRQVEFVVERLSTLPAEPGWQRDDD